MKKIIILICLVFLVSIGGAYAAPAGPDEGDTQAYTAIVPSMAAIAAWVEGFKVSYNDNGVYQAVADVFGDGRTPEEILINALEVEGINPQNLVAALYCAGAKPEDIRVAADDAGVSDMILVAGFETAKTVCGDEIADTQAYTPTGPNFASVPGGNGGGNIYGSPSAF